MRSYMQVSVLVSDKKHKLKTNKQNKPINIKGVKL